LLCSIAELVYSIERNLLDIFENLHAFFMAFESRLKAEGFKSRVINVVKVWEDWAVYPKDFLARLKCTFLGKQLAQITEEPKPIIEETDLDGAPLSGDDKEDEDLDGIPLDGAALLKSALLRSNAITDAMPLQKDVLGRRDEIHDDIDGVPCKKTKFKPNTLFFSLTVWLFSPFYPVDYDIDGIPLEKVAADISNKTGNLFNLKACVFFFCFK